MGMWEPARSSAHDAEVDSRVAKLQAEIRDLNLKLHELNKEMVHINGMYWEIYKRLEGIDR